MFISPQRAGLDQPKEGMETMSDAESHSPATSGQDETIEDLTPVDADTVKGGFNPQPEPPGKPTQRQ
jgi:hypothetical protein